MQIIKDKIVG